MSTSAARWVRPATVRSASTSTRMVKRKGQPDGLFGLERLLQQLRRTDALHPLFRSHQLLDSGENLGSQA